MSNFCTKRYFHFRNTQTNQTNAATSFLVGVVSVRVSVFVWKVDFVTHKLRILILVGANFLRIFLFGENVIKFVSSVFANKRETKKI